MPVGQGSANATAPNIPSQQMFSVCNLIHALTRIGISHFPRDRASSTGRRIGSRSSSLIAACGQGGGQHASARGLYHPVCSAFWIVAAVTLPLHSGTGGGAARCRSSLRPMKLGQVCRASTRSRRHPGSPQSTATSHASKSRMGLSSTARRWARTDALAANTDGQREIVGLHIGPSEGAIIRLIGAALLEANDEWQLQHRYMQAEAMAQWTPPMIDDVHTRISTMAA